MGRMAWAIIGVAAFFGLIDPSSAALAPNYQRARELGEVIDAVAATSMDPIDRVEFVDADLYRVRYGSCTVDARIVDVPPEPSSEPVAGPRDFEVVLGDPKC
jgi:hypothetical protein